MRILADQHISPRTVEFLKSLGHNAVRVSELVPQNASDSEIIALAAKENRIVLTQDLDFTALVVARDARQPSLILLRLGSPRVEHVNEVLQRVLPAIEQVVSAGAIVTVEDHRIRTRRLPIA